MVAETLRVSYPVTPALALETLLMDYSLSWANVLRIFLFSQRLRDCQVTLFDVDGHALHLFADENAELCEMEDSLSSARVRPYYHI